MDHIKKRCPACGETFSTWSEQTVFCSIECMQDGVKEEEPTRMTTQGRTFEQQLSNGNWVALPPEQVAEALQRALRTEQIVARNLERPAAQSIDELRVRLDNGQRLSTGPDWYAQIRRTPPPRPVVEVERVRVDCGHTTLKGSVMMASLGTSCPECYDDMSA